MDEQHGVVVELCMDGDTASLQAFLDQGAHFLVCDVAFSVGNDDVLKWLASMEPSAFEVVAGKFAAQEESDVEMDMLYHMFGFEHYLRSWAVHAAENGSIFGVDFCKHLGFTKPVAHIAAKHSHLHLVKHLMMGSEHVWNETNTRSSGVLAALTSAVDGRSAECIAFVFDMFGSAPWFEHTGAMDWRYIEGLLNSVLGAVLDGKTDNTSVFASLLSGVHQYYPQQFDKFVKYWQRCLRPGPTTLGMFESIVKDVTEKERDENHVLNFRKLVKDLLRQKAREERDMRVVCERVEGMVL
jgi:hypothetical protein